jgi:hypothetical protein
MTSMFSTVTKDTDSREVRSSDIAAAMQKKLDADAKFQAKQDQKWYKIKKYEGPTCIFEEAA